MFILRRRHALLLPLFWLRPAAAEGLTLEALLARLAAHGARRENFREQRRFAALDGVLDSTGTLSWDGTRLEKVTVWPQPERLEVQGDRLILTEGNNAPRVIDMSYATELRTLVDAIRGPLMGDAAALRRAFTTTVGGTADHWTLDLVPRDPAAAKLLRGVHMDGHGDQVDRTVLTLANGDEQAMTIVGR